MRINVVPYRPEWKILYEKIRRELHTALADLQPAIEHIGSTAVENLPAKPIIDVQVGVQNAADFDFVVERLCALPDYIYYEAFNPSMPQRRLFVKLQSAVSAFGIKNIFTSLEEIPHEQVNPLRLAHVHVWVFGSPDWVRHLAFREYLRAHADVRAAYATLKTQLSTQEWEHGMAYNDAKNAFMKKTEAEAIREYDGASIIPGDSSLRSE